MLKIGLIGCGAIGNLHALCYQALSENVKIVAVSDIIHDKAKSIADKFGSRIYSSGIELINNVDVDVIDICLPTYLHTKHAILAMEKGRHIFIEKPVCLSSEEADLLIDVQNRTGVKAQVGQVLRFWDEYVWLKDAVDDKRFGRLVSAVFARISEKPTWSWEDWYSDPDKSGSMALDLHIHDVDFVRYILKSPKNISSKATYGSDNILNQIFTTYEFDDTIVTTEGGWNFPKKFPFNASYRANFENATAIYNQGELVVYLKDGGKFIPEFTNNYEDDSDVVNIPNHGAYYNELKYFTDSLINGTKLEIAPLSEGIESVKLALKEILLAGGVRR